MHKTNRTLRARLLRDGEPGEPGVGGGGTPPPVVDGLGDAGKAALEKERAEKAEYKRAAAAEKAQREQLQAELEALKGATQTEQERAIEAARRETRTEILSTVNVRLVRPAVEAAAASGNFYDPADAVNALKDRFPEISVSDDGDVDKAKVAELVKEIADSKPHLVQSGTSGHRLPGQGTPPAAPKTGSVTAGADEYRRRKQANT